MIGIVDQEIFGKINGGIGFPLLDQVDLHGAHRRVGPAGAVGILVPDVRKVLSHIIIGFQFPVFRHDIDRGVLGFLPFRRRFLHLDLGQHRNILIAFRQAAETVYRFPDRLFNRQLSRFLRRRLCRFFRRRFFRGNFRHRGRFVRLHRFRRFRFFFSRFPGGRFGRFFCGFFDRIFNRQLGWFLRRFFCYSFLRRGFHRFVRGIFRAGRLQDHDILIADQFLQVRGRRDLQQDQIFSRHPGVFRFLLCHIADRGRLAPDLIHQYHGVRQQDSLFRRQFRIREHGGARPQLCAVGRFLFPPGLRRGGQCRQQQAQSQYQGQNPPADSGEHVHREILLGGKCTGQNKKIRPGKAPA